MVSLPDLKTLVLVNCQLEPDAVAVLKGHERFDNLEFRYVELNAQMFADLYDIRIRNSLHLMGTTIPKERAEQMRVDRPGLEISHRQGGFLGVICRNTAADICEVSDVVPGGGAANAGLEQGDVIIRIDSKKIVRFEDLQREINRHVPGDSVSIVFMRDGKEQSATAVLQKLRDE